MVRDHRRLRVFHEADVLVVETYQLTAEFPDRERFGLQSQLRRAAVSAAANIVEGSARFSAVEYCRFLEVARGSSCECAYLLGLSVRLRLAAADVLATARRYEGLSAALLAILKNIRARSSQ